MFGCTLRLLELNPADHRPRREMGEILDVFGDAKDGWGLAFWFAGLNSFLDDERPQDVMATDPERVIAARLAMLVLGHLIFGRGNHAFGIGSQDILWTLVVKEAVEPCKPECQSPPVLGISEDF